MDTHWMSAMVTLVAPWKDNPRHPEMAGVVWFHLLLLYITAMTTVILYHLPAQIAIVMSVLLRNFWRAKWCATPYGSPRCEAARHFVAYVQACVDLDLQGAWAYTLPDRSDSDVFDFEQNG